MYSESDEAQTKTAEESCHIFPIAAMWASAQKEWMNFSWRKIQKLIVPNFIRSCHMGWNPAFMCTIILECPRFQRTKVIVDWGSVPRLHAAETSSMYPPKYDGMRDPFLWKKSLVIYLVLLQIYTVIDLFVYGRICRDDWFLYWYYRKAIPKKVKKRAKTLVAILVQAYLGGYILCAWIRANTIYLLGTGERSEVSTMFIGKNYCKGKNSHVATC